MKIWKCSTNSLSKFESPFKGFKMLIANDCNLLPLFFLQKSPCMALVGQIYLKVCIWHRNPHCAKLNV